MTRQEAEIVLLKDALRQAQHTVAFLHNCKAAYLWANGNVMAFDEHGQQIPELQGREENVMEALRAAADESTEWYGFDGVPCDWPDSEPKGKV